MKVLVFSDLWEGSGCGLGLGSTRHGHEYIYFPKMLPTD